MEAHLTVCLLLALTLVVPWTAWGYQTGAPNKDYICTSLVPDHPYAPSAGPSPFQLAVANGGAAQGEPVNLTITSRHGFPFKGFMVQARVPGTLEPIGTFVVHDPDNTHTIDCLGGTSNTITHSNPTDKNSTSFQWVPPPDFHGQVVFNSTMVQTGDTFWLNVIANALSGDPALVGSTAGISTTKQPLTTFRTSTTKKPVTMSPVVKYQVNHPIYAGCYKNKSCFGLPANCENKESCNYMVSVLQRGKKFVFELMTSIDNGKYIAVGLSEDAKMGSDLVMECEMRNGAIRVYQSWNEGKTNSRLPNQSDIELKSQTYNDGIIYCQFERDDVTVVKNTNSNNVTFNLVDTKYFLLLAAGTSLKDGAVGFHDSIYAATGEKKLLSDVTGFSVDSRILIRLHGAFMIAAWIGAASIGVVLARYFKQTWTGSQMCGKDQWFAWHRLLMVLVWGLTIAAFVIIFVEVKAWSSADKHAILGVITTALAFFQPIGAIFRPSPDSRRRPFFNWAHWFVGNSAHILAIVTIFLAGQIPKADLPNWWIWIMVGYVAFHVIMHIMFSVAVCVSERQSSKRINSFPMKEMSNSRSPLASADRRQEAPHSCFRKFLLASYIFGVLVVTIALIVIVVLAPIQEKIQQITESLSNVSDKV